MLQKMNKVTQCNWV